MSVVNVINGSLVILVGVLYFAFLPEIFTARNPCIADTLCGLYCVLNGLIFINFSTGCIKGLDACNRKNFGFMYTFYGRFFFVVFCGSLCFGLKDPSQKTVVGNEVIYGSHWLGILTGVISWLSALFNVWAMCNYPEYSLDRGGMLTSATATGGDNGAIGIKMEQGRFTDVAKPQDTGAEFGGNPGQDDNPFA